MPTAAQFQAALQDEANWPQVPSSIANVQAVRCQDERRQSDGSLPDGTSDDVIPVRNDQEMSVSGGEVENDHVMVQLQGEVDNLENRQDVSVNPRQRPITRRQTNRTASFKAALNYSPAYEASLARIGEMSIICQKCWDRKFQGETKGFCCSDGIIQLLSFQAPPTLFQELFEGETRKSNVFLRIYVVTITFFV